MHNVRVTTTWQPWPFLHAVERSHSHEVERPGQDYLCGHHQLQPGSRKVRIFRDDAALLMERTVRPCPGPGRRKAGDAAGVTAQLSRLSPASWPCCVSAPTGAPQSGFIYFTIVICRGSVAIMHGAPL